MTTPADRATILAVDDLPEYRRLYRRRLEDDYDVLTAESGSDALDALDDRVDVVLLDREMPDMSGDAVLSTIREEDHACRVAMVTAEEPDSDVIEIGFDDYLVKPVTTERLNETVERLLARSFYDAHLRELYSLCVTRAEERPADGPAGQRDADGRLDARIRDVRSTVDEAVGAFQTADFRASFRDLDPLDE